MNKHMTVQLFSIAICLLTPMAFTANAMAQGDQNDLQQQMRAMQTKIALLEAALKQNHAAQSSSGQNMTGMAGMKMGDSGTSSMQQMKGMGTKGSMSGGMKMGEKSDMDQMPEMPMDESDGQGMGMMGMMNGMQMGGGGMGMGMMSKGMMMMGKMKSMGDMGMPSSLPGFPGASHIYHIGADAFFLDHSEHITLTTQQQTTINKIKEKAMLKQADFDRQIESAEQEVWVLTSSDSPDAKQIEEKISEVAKLQADQRISYIRAVGEAAQTLTGEQRSSLTGATNNEEAEK